MHTDNLRLVRVSLCPTVTAHHSQQKTQYRFR